MPGRVLLERQEGRGQYTKDQVAIPLDKPISVVAPADAELKMTTIFRVDGVDRDDPEVTAVNLRIHRLHRRIQARP